MPFYDPLAAQFANRPLDAWQVSKKNFDFEMGFVAWIRKYLETRKLPCDVVSAKAWINKSKFDGERYELCELQWEAYQESLKVAERPSLKPVVLNSGLSGGVGDGAGESGVDGADDAVGTSPSPSLEGGGQEDLPDRFRKLEGESGDEYRARMARIVSESIKKVGSW